MKLSDILFLSRRIEKKLINLAHHRQLRHTILKLLERGLSIPVIYDIGARTGDWSDAISKILPKSEFVLFEATEKCRSSLESRPFQYFIEVLSDQEKTVEFYEKGSAGDSYYKEFTSHYENIVPTKRITATLQGVVQKNGLSKPTFLKLDTQGSEIDILRGAGGILESVDLMYIECPIVKYNAGAPTLADYLGAAESFGFVPYDICEHHLSFDVLVQIDIMFIRKTTYARLYPEALGVNYDVV